MLLLLLLLLRDMMPLASCRRWYIEGTERNKLEDGESTPSASLDPFNAWSVSVWLHVKS